MLKSLALVALVAAAWSAAAQPVADPGAFPQHPVKFVVPYPPGGGVDVLIRAVAQELSLRWKQAVIVENRAGAGGIIGTQAVANAAPNGETLLATADSPLTANRFLYKSLPYSPDKSFAPVIRLIRNYNFIIANSAVPANNLRELVNVAKSSGTRLNYGSYGAGSHPHLAFATLARHEGLDLVHIPYKGVVPLTMALVANEVPLGTGTFATAGEHIKAGTLKALAYMGPNRSPDFPGVPTTAELGMGYLVSPVWQAVFAPAGTPQAIVEKINADIRSILSNPDFAQRNVISKGQEVVAGTPAELEAAVREDSAIIGEMVRATGLKPE